MKYEELTHRQRAAIAISALDAETSAKVLESFDAQAKETLAADRAGLGHIPDDVKEKAVEECYQLLMGRRYVSQGGPEFARDMLGKAVGSSKAESIMQRLDGLAKGKGFSMLRDIDPKLLTTFLANEHPQTISLVLTNLQPNQAAAVLSELTPELQADVAMRIATMGKIAPEVLKEMESALEHQFAAQANGGFSASGGAQAVAEILNLIDSTAEKNFLRTMEANDQALTSEIKNMMFVFDDITQLDNRSVQRMLKDINSRDLTYALKVASEEVKDKIFGNVSERVELMIQEELEYMGPVRLSEVEVAQGRIVEAIRRLEEEGQIVISGRGRREDIIV